MKRLMAAVFLAGLSPAFAESQTAVIHIRGEVPVVCKADFLALPPQHGPVVPVGTLTEFCNDGLGYQIVADYVAGSDPGRFIIDGIAVPLSPSGHSILARMNGPRAITQSIAYQPGSTPITTVSIRLQASSL